MNSKDTNSFKGADDLTKVQKLISEVFIPMEEQHPNVKTLLDNFSKTVKESIMQLSGSRAIDIPDNIEPNDERAIRDRETLQYYRQLLVDIINGRAFGHKR